MQQYLLRYGEIGTKSEKIRRNFVDILIQNIERTFLKYKKEVFIERERGRIFVFTENENVHLLSRIFGIVSYSPVIETSSDISSMKDKAKIIGSNLSGTFAVRARRVGQHDYTSPEAAGEVGSAILSENPKLKVDLDDPQNEIYLEIRNEKAYIFGEIFDGPGGLPLSSQGKIASYLGERNDFLATWLMMKRGARAYIFHDPETHWIDELDNWDPNLKILGEGEKNEFLNLDLPDEIQGIVLGDTLESIQQIKHNLPIFRPLIAFTEKRINKNIEIIESLVEK